MSKTSEHLCKICNHQTFIAFYATILHTHEEAFYKCPQCGFLSVGNAHWLKQSYAQAINITDTGLVARNLYLYKIASVVAYFFNAHKAATFMGGGAISLPIVLDIGGGTGLLTRLLRDVGFEAQWSDEYCDNIFAQGFTYDNKQDKQIALATCFEVFEHLPDPLHQIESMLDICPNILFSTELLPCDVPQSNGENTWWYYGFEHGQHISFYTKQSLQFIAKKRKLFFYSFFSIHLLSTKRITLFALLIKIAHRGLFTIIQKQLQSKTFSDSIMLQALANQRS